MNLKSFASTLYVSFSLLCNPNVSASPSQDEGCLFHNKVYAVGQIINLNEKEVLAKHPHRYEIGEGEFLLAICAFEIDPSLSSYPAQKHYVWVNHFSYL